MASAKSAEDSVPINIFIGTISTQGATPEIPSLLF